MTVDTTMTLDEFQFEAMSTAEYPGREETSLLYPALGLVGEAGEVAEKIKKLYRNKGITNGYRLEDEDRTALGKEIFDVMWYAAALANAIDLGLSDVAAIGLAKLKDRKERGVIKSEGDNR